MRRIHPVFTSSDRAIVLPECDSVSKPVPRQLPPPNPINIGGQPPAPAKNNEIGDLIGDVEESLNSLTLRLARLKSTANKINVSREALRLAEEHPFLIAENESLKKQIDELQARLGLIRDEHNDWENDKPANKAMKNIGEILK